MELHLTFQNPAESVQGSPAYRMPVAVYCAGAFSHAFDLYPLQPVRGGCPPIDPASYGSALYAALFPSDSPAQRALAQERERLLFVTADEPVEAIAWEYLHGPRGFLICDLPFVRALPPAQRIDPPRMLSGCHIVAVPSNPLEPRLAPLNVEGEWQNLAAIVREMDSAVTLERAWPPTINRLRALLVNQQHRIVHFMGHGDGGKNRNGDAVLCFEQDNGTLALVDAREFTTRLRGSVLLVTLNACRSAEPGETSFSNLAAALVREGIPYALGMRFSIYDEDALIFSRAFYDNLARGVPVEEAVLQMRLDLARSPRSWAIGVPVPSVCRLLPVSPRPARPWFASRRRSLCAG